jgi:hypothetical protein
MAKSGRTVFVSTLTLTQHKDGEGERATLSLLISYNPQVPTTRPIVSNCSVESF